MDPGLRDYSSNSSSSHKSDDIVISQDVCAVGKPQQQPQQPQQQRANGTASKPQQQRAACAAGKHTHNKLGFLEALPNKRDVVRQFTPSWFAVTMGTGTVSLSVISFPFHFSGQDDIALAAWALNVVLFVIFSCLMIGRAVFYPKTMVYLWRHPNQSLFVGAIPMSFSTLTNGVVAFLIPRHGVHASQVAQALFWANLPAVVLCVVLIPFTMFTVHDNGMKSMTAVWLLPVVPACVAANTAGVVAKSMPSETVGMAMVFMGVVLLGIGFLLAQQIITIYYNRLILHNLPAREVIVSSFLPVGPTAMTALGLMNLALAADHHLIPFMHTQEVQVPLDDKWITQIGQVLVIAGGMLALCVWGYALWWLVVAISSVADTMRQGVPFNLGWWGSVFPVGTVTIATCQLATFFNSQALTYMGAVTVCIHLLLWLVVVTMTARKAWVGQLFHAPCLHSAALAAAAAAAAAAGGGATGGAPAAGVVQPSSLDPQGKNKMSPAASRALSELEGKLQSSPSSMVGGARV